MKRPKAILTGAIAVIGGITTVLGLLTLDQLNDPPVFTTEASEIAGDNQGFELVVTATGQYALRNARFHFYLADADGGRVLTEDVTDGQFDYLVPLDMLVAPQASKFGFIPENSILQSIENIEFLYICGSFRGRVAGTWHSQTYLLARQNNGFAQSAHETALGLFSRPDCQEVQYLGQQFSPLGSPESY